MADVSLRVVTTGCCFMKVSSKKDTGYSKVVQKLEKPELERTLFRPRKKLLVKLWPFVPQCVFQSCQSSIKRTHTHFCIKLLLWCCCCCCTVHSRTNSCQQIHSFNGLLTTYYTIVQYKQVSGLLSWIMHSLPACFVCFSGSFILFFIFNSCRVCSFLLVLCVCMRLYVSLL